MHQHIEHVKTHQRRGKNAAMGQRLEHQCRYTHGHCHQQHRQQATATVFHNKGPVTLHVPGHETDHAEQSQHTRKQHAPAGGSGQAHCLRPRSKIAMNTRLPAIASRLAEGTSYGWISKRPSRSAASISAAPHNATSTMPRRMLSPTSARTKLRTSSPTKGKAPAVITTLALISATISTPSTISAA